jgi:hypothetical protein
MQRTHVINEYVVEKTTASGTDWVLTFPTKHLLVGVGFAISPFQRPLTKTGACDDISLALYNREESNSAPNPSNPDFSPLPPTNTPLTPALCWEANVITFNNGNVLGSANFLSVATRTVPLVDNAGWMDVSFRAGATTTATGPVGFDPTTLLPITPATTFSGLPTVGFAVQTFVNGTLTDATGKLIQSSYGGNFGHRYVGPQP